MNAMSGLFFNSKTYELPIAKTYVRHWGMAEAIREIIQNAIDSDSPFEYQINGDQLRVHSRFARLTASTLLLGATTKAENKDKIGSFGEGYKIALLVLARAEYGVRVLNSDRLWVPSFAHSRQFDAEVLCIEDAASPEKVEGLIFEVSGLSPADIAEVRASCLFMQDHIGAIASTSYGNILMEQPGRLYVGGLFICKTKLTYGYDIKPEFLSLERDRQTVSTFDLQLIAKDMWFETESWDQIAQMIGDEIKDMEYAEFGAPEMVKEACYRAFRAKHPGAIVAKDQEELDRLVKSGMTRVVVSHAYAPLVQSARSYQSVPIIAVERPYEAMLRWLRENRKDMRTGAIVAFKELLADAEGWKLK